MMKIKMIIVFSLTLSLSYELRSQTNQLTGSPYSLFGLGVDSNSNIGINSSLGRSGIAMDSINAINLLNPASIVTLPTNRFFLDIGGLAEISSVDSNDGSESRFTSNFSNIAFGFKTKSNIAFVFSLQPATSTGYALIGLQENIEGSTETFTSNVTGSGGLNDLRLDFGKRISKKLNVGLYASYSFGTIDEDETITTNNSLLTIEEQNNYQGVRFGLGTQYALNQKYNFGATLDFPTKLNATKETAIQKITGFALSELRDNINNSIDDFYVPFELGVGATRQYKNWLFALDYKRSFWNATNQSDNIGDFVDQNVFSFGVNYGGKKYPLNYAQSIQFRAGLNYDTGYLEIDNERIENFNASVGIGLPLDRSGSSLLNISYTRGIQGNSQGILVRENYNLININLSLSSLWFQKRIYD